MSIYAKLLAAQKSITAIAKTGHNTHFKYDFFEEREVLKVAREALNDAGLVFFYSVDGVVDREVVTSKGREELLTDVTMSCTIYDAETGESVTGGAIGRGQDGQDKGINKAIVAGLKYWLLKVLMIPTDDDTERTENTNAGGNAPRPKGRSAPAPATDDMIDCPECGGPMWDNREGKKSPKSPDLKCKDKTCDHAVWLKSWRDDLKREVAGAHEAQLIDAEQRVRAEEVLDGLSPALMLALAQRLDTLVQKGILGG